MSIGRRWIVLCGALLALGCQQDGPSPTTSAPTSSSAAPTTAPTSDLVRQQVALAPADRNAALPNDLDWRPPVGSWSAEFVRRSMTVMESNWISLSGAADTRGFFFGYPPSRFEDTPPSHEAQRKLLGAACDGANLIECMTVLSWRSRSGLVLAARDDRPSLRATTDWFVAGIDVLERLNLTDALDNESIGNDLQMWAFLLVIDGRFAEASRTLGMMDRRFRLSDVLQFERDRQRKRDNVVQAAANVLFMQGRLRDLISIAGLGATHESVQFHIARALSAGVARAPNLTAKRALLAVFLDLGPRFADRDGHRLSAECNAAHIALDAGGAEVGRDAVEAMVSRYLRLGSDRPFEIGLCLWRLAPRVQAREIQGRLVAAMRAKRLADEARASGAGKERLEKLRQDELVAQSAFKVDYAPSKHWATEEVRRALRQAVLVEAPIQASTDVWPRGPLLMDDSFENALTDGLEASKQMGYGQERLHDWLCQLVLDRYIYLGD